jgi:serine/threonine-protein phosphatase 4 catalytic subunit/serine/threonine-protein phosphatase PP1-1
MHKIIENLKNGILPSKTEVNELISKVSEILYTESAVINISTPIHVVGDIHGQYSDLLNIFNRIGFPPNKSFLFLGDYVDRGEKSTETILLLFALKATFPTKIFLIRGNHETKEISRTYGFYDEVYRKYGDSRVWRYIHLVFDFLPTAALIDGRYFCAHGGISEKALTIAKINKYKISSCLHDIVWSDPMGHGFSASTRGAGRHYGSDVTSIFLEVNNLKGIVRSHQMVFEGFRFHFKEKNVVTVWSATDYCRRFRNLGSVLKLDTNHEITADNFLMFYPK